MSNFSDVVNVTTTVSPETDESDAVPSTRFRFVFVPLCVIAALLVVTTIVYMMVRRKRLDRLRHHLVPLYNFDPGECEDWEAELLEDPGDQRSQKKIQDYKSMGSPTATSEH